MSARRNELSDLPDWPRLMTPAQAAQYCSLSISTLRRAKVPSIIVTGRTRRYDRVALDAWISAYSGATMLDEINTEEERALATLRDAS